MKSRIVKKISKYFASSVLCASLLFSISINSVSAATKLFEAKTSETVSNGVTYEKIQQVTNEGLLDIFVMKINVDDPFISLMPVESKQAYGLKEPTSKILTDNSAIAGVNGDFFGMKGEYSASIGPVFRENKLISLSSLINEDNNGFASFYISKKNVPFITYLKTEIEFLNNGKKSIDIFAINKITDMVMPIAVNGKAFTSTKPIDDKFPDLMKVVVEDNKIKYVSRKGEPVDIPENGYAIVMSGKSADGYYNTFSVGQTAELKVKAPLDFNDMITGFGGGARILLEGKAVRDSSQIIDGRQPRTVLGITQDKKQIILMVVDGRSHSIGATHEEIADLLLSQGAYNAMHLDGGGSSTMAVKNMETKELEVVNTVSDNAQRKVINTIGVFDVAPVGDIVKLVVKPITSKIFRNMPVKIDIYGVDQYNHRIDIPREEIVISSSDTEGVFVDENFIPHKLGEISLWASYKDFAADFKISTTEITELQASQSTIRLSEGGKNSLSFSGVDTDGNKIPILTGISYQVVPPNIGHMDYGTFVADQFGKGYLKCTAGEISTYVEVYVGGKNVMLSSFEDSNRAIRFVAQPSDTVTGSAAYTKNNFDEATQSIELKYNFPLSDATLAAYMEFPEPFVINDKPVALKLSVFGDKSDKWLRAKMLDGDDKEFTVDLARNVNWEGWSQVLVNLPADVKFPIKLSRIYLASTDNREVKSGSLFFDKLIGVYNVDLGAVEKPDSPKFVDPLKVELDEVPKEGTFDITLLGDMKLEKNKPETYNEIQTKVLAQFKKHTKRGLFAGETDIAPNIGIGVYQWNTGYIMHAQDNVGIVQMSAEKGSFWETNPAQWQKFVADVEKSGKDHIIVTMDINLLKAANKKEFELFNDQLVKFRNAGKTVFVVSTEGLSTTSTIVNGIRYINVGGLFKADGTTNDGFRMLRFRINGKEISYDLQKKY